MCTGTGSVRRTKRVFPTISRMVRPSSLSISRTILGLFGHDELPRRSTEMRGCDRVGLSGSVFHRSRRWPVVIEAHDATAADWMRFPEWESFVRTWAFPSSLRGPCCFPVGFGFEVCGLSGRDAFHSFVLIFVVEFPHFRFGGASIRIGSHPPGGSCGLAVESNAIARRHEAKRGIAAHGPYTYHSSWCCERRDEKQSRSQDVRGKG